MSTNLPTDLTSKGFTRALKRTPDPQAFPRRAA
jgi:hypothetical protein